MSNMIDSLFKFFEGLPELLKSLLLLFIPLIDSDNRLYWIYLIGSFLIIFIIYSFQEGNLKSFSLKNIINYCFPSDVYQHPSAILDYQCYFVNGLFKILVSLTGFFTLSKIITSSTIDLIEKFLGTSPIDIEVNFFLKIIYTLLAILLLDFSAFFHHYLMHKVPLLWEFHKVHHKAERLNPITGFRDHPIDIAFKETLIVIFLSVFLGIFMYVFTTNIMPFSIGSLFISTFLFRPIINLRHSHIWISYGWHLDHIFSSPAMHRIHHSKNSEHIDKNFGLIFSFWDYLFNTIYVPKYQEKFAVGIPTQKDYDNVWQLYYFPFVQAYEKVSKFFIKDVG